MTPFCATYVHLDDPELQAQSRQMYTPYSIEEHLIVAHGGSSFGSPAFSPRTGLLYVTGKNAAVSMIVRPLGDSLEPGPHGDGHSANFEELSRIPAYTPTTTLTAYEPATGEEAWQAVFPALTPIGASGNLATAGDLVFQGADDGAFYAFHAATGEQLFRYQAQRGIRSEPDDLRGERQAVRDGDRDQHGADLRAAVGRRQARLRWIRLLPGGQDGVDPSVACTPVP